MCACDEPCVHLPTSTRDRTKRRVNCALLCPSSAGNVTRTYTPHIVLHLHTEEYSLEAGLRGRTTGQDYGTGLRENAQKAHAHVIMHYTPTHFPSPQNTHTDYPKQSAFIKNNHIITPKDVLPLRTAKNLYSPIKGLKIVRGYFIAGTFLDNTFCFFIEHSTKLHRQPSSSRTLNTSFCLEKGR